jgi:putative endonuclease
LDERGWQPAVYIMASERNGTLYVGVTSDLVRRVYQHRTGALSGFTSRYGCKLFVFFEIYADMRAAIAREKQIKGGSRAKKMALITARNPMWRIFTMRLFRNRHPPSLRGAMPKQSSFRAAAPKQAGLLRQAPRNDFGRPGRMGLTCAAQTNA